MPVGRLGVKNAKCASTSVNASKPGTGAVVDLRDYLRTIRRRWALIAVTLLAVVGAAATLTATATPLYASSARIFVSTTPTTESDAYQGGLFSAQRVTSYADLIQNSRDLAQTVITDLSLDLTPDELISKVESEVVPETVIIGLTVKDPDPAEAQRLAQAYADALSDMVRELETPEGSSSPLLKATTVDPATRSSAPVSPNPVRNIGLGVALGLLLGLAVALLREVLDTTIKSVDSVAEAVNAPVLGAIAYDGSARQRPLVTELESHAPRVEAFRVLRTNLQFVKVDAANKVFVVTSAVPGEGKTTTAVNLAITMAEAGHRTLLIECDLRRPRAIQALGLDEAVGVTTVLVGKVSLDDAIQKHVDSNLHVLGSGAIPPNPAELLQSRAMHELLTEVRDRYDMVIIDAPPLLPVTDAALLSAQADGALLIVRHGRTTRDQLDQAVDRLLQVGATPVGVVMNWTPARGPRSGYGYGYGYSYGYGYAPTVSSTVASGKRTNKASRRKS